jgi:hypothetical protein
MSTKTKIGRDEVLLTWNGADVAKRAQALINKSTWTIGLAVMSDAKQLCPVDFGYLAASIMTASQDKDTELGSPKPASKRFTGKKAGNFQHASLLLAPPSFKKIKRPGSEYSGAQVFVGTAVDYGPYVEFGTIRSSAQPFLRPALDMARGKTLTIVKVDAKMTFGEYLK